MDHGMIEADDYREKDIAYNRVSSSRFIFYVQVVCMLALAFGMCFRLWEARYKGKPDIEIQGSTKYVPEYK